MQYMAKNPHSQQCSKSLSTITCWVSLSYLLFSISMQTACFDTTSYFWYTMALLHFKYPYR